VSADQTAAGGPVRVARPGTRLDRYAFGLTAAKRMAARDLDIGLAVTAGPW